MRPWWMRGWATWRATRISRATSCRPARLRGAWPRPRAPDNHARGGRQTGTPLPIKANKKGIPFMTSLPHFIAPARFDNAEAALAQVQAIYRGSIEHLRESVRRFVAGENTGEHVRACYPFVRVRSDTAARADSRLSYGFVAGSGTFETTLTRP